MFLGAKSFKLMRLLINSYNIIIKLCALKFNISIKLYKKNYVAHSYKVYI